MRALLNVLLILPLCSSLMDTADAATAYLIVDGEVTTTLMLSEADFKSLPHKSLELKDAGGVEIFGGVDLGDILRRAGVPLQQDLKGKDVAKYLHAQGADGFVAVFALPEFDLGTFLVADSVNGQPLANGTGPLQIISPGETRHSRWIKQLIRLKIMQSEKQP